MTRAIDTHIHIWNFEKAEYSWLDGNTTLLNRSYLIDELEIPRKESMITAGVLVQAANTEIETSYMIEVAAQQSWIKGVVGWLPLTDPARTALLLEEGYCQHPLFRGMRHLIHDEPQADWLLQPTVIESLRLLATHGFPYDVVGINNEHLETVLKLMDKVPGLRLVLDHLNQPPIGNPLGRWGELIKELATNPNAYAKISGLGTTTGKGETWTVEDIKPYVNFALEQFGASRMFCGGDWPVSLLAGSYTHAWEVYRKTLAQLVSPAEEEQILSGNAATFYKLAL